jgi:hypothetical protein
MAKKARKPAPKAVKQRKVSLSEAMANSILASVPESLRGYVQKQLDANRAKAIASAREQAAREKRVRQAHSARLDPPRPMRLIPQD